MLTHLFPRSQRKRRAPRLWTAATPLFALGGGSEQNVQYMLGIVVLCIGVGLVLSLLSLRARRARRIEGQIQRNIVLETIQNTMHTQGRLDMYPLQRASNANAPTLSGLCSACSPEGLQVDFTLTPQQPDWPHRSVDIFFHECNDEERVFHAFTANIQRTVVNNGHLIADMTLPANLRCEQKRALFRLTPPHAMVVALALWPMNAEQDLLDETCGRAMGHPMCAYRPHRIDQTTVLNLSAGGIRLRLDAEHCRRLGAQPAPGDSFILLAVFGDKQGIIEPRQFWFKCLCRHTGIHPEGKKDPFVGLQFRSWSLTQKLTDPISWHEVVDGGEVPPLFEWLMTCAREMSHAIEDPASCRIKL